VRVVFALLKLGANLNGYQRGEKFGSIRIIKSLTT
jgi:hypothetical protein